MPTAGTIRRIADESQSFVVRSPTKVPGQYYLIDYDGIESWIEPKLVPAPFEGDKIGVSC
jgi:hypothetical protein